MAKAFKAAFGILGALMALVAFVVAPVPQAGAQTLLGLVRTTPYFYHTTVGTSTAAAIPSGSLQTNLLGWSICNDAVNGSSTYLYVSNGTPASTAGQMLDKGKCYTCPNCNAHTLGTMYVLGQGSSNGYSVVQYKQQ